MSCIHLSLLLALSLVACGEVDDDTGSTGGGGAEDGGGSGGGTADGGTGDGGTEDGGPDTSDDRDRDGLSNDDEAALGTDPDDRDTDGDGQTDAAELAGGSDPLDDTSTLDGIYVEVAAGGTGTGSTTLSARVLRGDIVFVLDTSAAGLDHLFAPLGGGLDELAEELATLAPAPAWGLATFEDYAYGSMGSLGTDLPFHLEQELTLSASTVGSRIADLQVRAGGDAMEAGIEALYQALTGAGYDQNCDGTYDVTTDILPYQATKTDPFGGTAGQGATSSALGSRGGLGFRDLGLPLVVLATDNFMRDPDQGHDTPVGCPGDAGSGDAVAASADLGALVGGLCLSTLCTTPMQDLVSATGTLVDLDGDGDADEVPVLEWLGTDGDALVEGLGEQLLAMLEAVDFERLEVVLAGDLGGLDGSLSASTASPIALGNTVTLEAEISGTVPAEASDQVVVVPLQVLGDGTVLVGDSQLVVVVPGE